MNGNISALQVLVEAEKNKIGITKVEPLTQNNQAIGYTIYFSEGDPITIYHGKDGENGQDGKPGSSGDIPQIGVKLDKDGNYYWTIDGSWLTDDGGNKIRANGLDGEPGKDGQQGANGKPGQDGQNGTDGANGTNGKDGVTPQLKIENGRWLVSVDQGSTWSDVGPATAESGDLIFQEVDFSDTNFVKFTLTDGTELELVTKYAYETLKSGVDQLNTEIGTLRQLITALQNRDYITNVIAVYENDQEIGYKISFASGMSITIRHGEKGEQGTQGEPGQPGQNGSTPIVGVKQDTDNIYYWTLNGEWLLDSNGQKVRAQGLDGQNGTDGQPGAPGSDGQNGKDGVTPQLKIENNYWYVSTDNGQTWTQLGKASGENGQDGKDGADGESLFQSVSVTSDRNYVIFTLQDGTTTIEVPTKQAYETLQQSINTINTNISGLQTIVTNLQNNDYVTSVVPVVDNGETIGYTINFSRSSAVTIYHGQKGDPGINGTSPIISVKQENGIYYWTVNGSFLTDENGDKVKAEGPKGADGTNGTNGNDGITPKFKIENGNWYISLDNGTSWEYVGQATGDKGETGPVGPAGPAGSGGDCFFQSVTNTTDSLILVLQDGTTITLPKQTALSITFSIAQQIYRMAPGKAMKIDFTITGANSDLQLTVSGGYESNVTYTSAGSTVTGTINLTASFDEKKEAVILFAKSGSQSSWESVMVETNYFYAEVGDIYYQNNQAKGVIWKKRTDTGKGIAISFLEGYPLFWYTGYTGYLTPTQWAEKELGISWYIPEIDELLSCMEAIKTYGREAFNSILTNHGYNQLSKHLWSVTKASNATDGSVRRWAVYVNDSGEITKQEFPSGQNNWARAMIKF